MRADRDEDRVVRCLQGLELLRSDGRIRVKRNVVQGQNGPDIFIQPFPREAIRGNAVAHHTARLLFFFKDVDRVAHERQEVRAGKARRARADDGDLAARGREFGGERHFVRGRLINGKALHGPDVDGSVDQAPPAAFFAGVFAHEGAGRGEGIVAADERHGVRRSSGGRECNVARNVDVRGAERFAGHGLPANARDGWGESRRKGRRQVVEIFKNDPARFPAERAVRRIF